MELKQLSLDDRESITRLFTAVFTAEPWKDDWSNTRQLNAYIDDLIGQNNSLTLGYFDGPRMVALSMGHIKHWYKGTEYSIDELCVETQAQGKGIGTAFVKAIEAFLAEKRIYHIFLQTGKDMPAYRFYRNRGFQELIGHVSFAKQFGE